jgi:hypothetical protein
MLSGIGRVIGAKDSALCTAPSREVFDSTLLFRVALSRRLLSLTEQSAANVWSLFGIEEPWI